MDKPENNRKCIFILGMHRSGTSAFAGSLRALGFELGDNLMPANAFNEKGYFEDLDIYHLNDRILNSYGRTWDSLYPFEIVKTDVLKREIQEIYLQKFGSSDVSVIKDPRISFLFPVWQWALKELNIQCYAVIMLRNPGEVADSLKRRDRFSFIKSLLLWTRYTLSAEQNTRSIDREFVSYENFLKDPNQYISSLTTLISSDINVTKHSVEEINNFIDPSLRHHQLSKIEMPEGFGWVAKLWMELSNNKHDTSVFDEALTQLKRTLKLYYPEDIQRTLSTDVDFSTSALHIDTGSGFDGLKKVHVPFNYKQTNFSVSYYSLEKFKGIRSVRWDPTESYFIKLQLDSITAVDLQGKQFEIDKNKLRSNGISTLDKPVEFHTTDPWVEIPLSTPISEITIRGKIWLLDTRNIFLNLNSQIAQTKKELQTADNTRKVLAQEKNELFNEVKAQLVEIRKLVIEKSDLVKQVSEKSIHLANASAENAKSIAELKQLKSEFSVEKKTLLNQIEESGLKIKNLLKEKSDLIFQIDKQKIEISKLYQEKDELITQFNSEQFRVRQVEKELNSCKVIIKNLEDKIQSETKKFNEKVKTLEADVKIKSSDLIFYRALIDDLPASAFSKLAKRILYRVDRLFSYKTRVPDSYLLTPLVFDPAYYQEANPQLKDIIKGDAELSLKHWLERGVNEGLPGSPCFHVSYYLQKNKDLKRYFKKNYQGAIKHWIDWGVNEMRVCSPEFSLQSYLSMNPQIATTYANDHKGALLYWFHNVYKKDDENSINDKANIENHNVEVKKIEGDRKSNNHNRNKHINLISDSTERIVDQHIWSTKRKKMDGKRLLSQARNREHFWYHNEVIDEVLANAHQLKMLPKDIRKLLVIAHDFRHTTGVTRPISHYLNAMIALGGHEFTSIELAPDAHARVALNHIQVHDFVIVNSIAPFFRHDGMIKLISDCSSKKVAIYLHETEWVFNKLKNEYPERFNYFISTLPRLNLLCVSNLQQDWLRREFGATSTYLVRNATILTGTKNCTAEKKHSNQMDLHIVMAGTIQPRKGVTLFSKVADLAFAHNLPWHFSWAGKQVCKEDEVYKSNNVEWLGDFSDERMIDLMNNADIFFLSSEDDPFPLCVLEALQAKKPVVCFAKTGVSELFVENEKCPGVVFSEYSPEAALEALQRAASLNLADKDFEDLNKSLSLFSFVSRINGAIDEIYRK